MTTRYRQMQPEERMVLASMRAQGCGLRAIGQVLGRSAGTLSRELARNSSAEGGYTVRDAQAACTQRRGRARPAAKLDDCGRLWPLVAHMLLWRWSPQQISRRLARRWPHRPELNVSHETIYNAIYAYPRGELRRQLVALLRQGRSTRRPRSGGADRRGQIPEMLSIHVRPPEVGDRLMPGHWEGDLIRGSANRSAVAVLVERTTRLVLPAKMPDASAESALAAFTAKLNSIAAPLRRTLTCDQGREMARRKQLTQTTGVKVYFCGPHSPWQRGSCENTDGLLRQFLPKGTNLSVHNQDALDSIDDLMNNRPRQTLNWRSPIEAFAELMQALNDKAQGATVH